MKAVIRVDASLNMGTGHVMRCLTLAEALKKEGADIVFICREHEGHLLERIEQQGFKTHALPNVHDEEKTANAETDNNELYGRCWLGSTQQQDAELCRPLLEKIQPDWLIVDHYGIDQAWQTELAPYYGKLMVIDDLANRGHQCDVLLDQTYGRQVDDYVGLVPQQAKLLLGSTYALLRPEFAEWRDYSLQRRRKPEFKKLLITMGGVDPDNITGEVLTALEKSSLPDELEIIIVMGATAPHLESVKRQSKLMANKVSVKVNVDNMAEIMANADLAIGAAGATTWERCCLGLPSIQIVIAKNQEIIAELISKAGGALCLTIRSLHELCNKVFLAKSQSAQLIKYSSALVNGSGTVKVMKYLK